MADTPEFHSSVALIERIGPTPVFFLEHRLSPGDYPYSGKYGFFGGGAEPHEDPWSAIIREVRDEELGIYVPRNQSLDWKRMETSRICGEGRDGAQVIRTVTLFHLLLPSGSRVRAKERDRSEVAQIPVSFDAISSMEQDLTPYAYRHLLARIKGEGPWKGAKQ